MAVTVHLPEEVETRLRDCAVTTNRSEEDIVRRALEAYLAVPPSLRDEMEGWQQLGSEALERVAPNSHEAW